MRAQKNISVNHGQDPFGVLVWDLPTRLFHWLLVLAVAGAVISGMLGGLAMIWHARAGIVVLALVVFRLAWGFAGNRQARFADFVAGPAAVIDYAKTLLSGKARPWLGHNPMGGWSILAMLAALLVQAGTGLFANDDIFLQGPLADRVGQAASTLLTRVHLLNRWVLVSLICLHLTAVAFYFIIKKENLIAPMLTGFKRWPEPVPEAGHPWRALPIALAAALVVYLLVRQ